METGYLSGLNEKQREAVLITDGPLMVLAGAGSGKTRMLTSRIVHLAETCGVQPHSILAVTFTNKAAGEMRERVLAGLSGGGAVGVPEIGTFHAVCVRILRREMALTPFSKQFVIYDDADQLSLLKKVVERLGIDDKKFSPKSMQSTINRAKCDALAPDDIAPAPHDVFTRQMKRAYEEYQKDLMANNALDFGEIICMTYRILRDHPEARAKYQSRYRYVHVDEYQDTNRSQYLLLSLLASREHGGHGNICVVGDEDQSIYRWRGADIRNILDFERDFPGARVVKLEQNYRSTKNIITAASHLISHNSQRKDKTLWTANRQGDLVKRWQLADERAEAELVTSELRRLAAERGYAYSDFAIFYRTHAQSRQFEDLLRRDKIPYRVVGGLRFYDRKEIKDILAYFKVVYNAADSVSLTRIINVPARGIGKTSLDKIEALHAEMKLTSPITLWQALCRVAGDPGLTSPAVAKKTGGFVRIVDHLIEEQPRLTLRDLYHLVLDETGYARELKQEGTEEALARVENLEEFDSILQEFEEDMAGEEKASLLGMFLEQTSLVTEEESAEGAQASSVSLMTLHSSKGLEFPAVFLVGMEDGLFPSIRSWEDNGDEEMEEERRLCYVGMTRARERLYMTGVAVRRLWGDIKYQEPARFFAEIPDAFIEFKDLSHGAAAGTYKTGSSKHFYAPASDLVGRSIDHPDYGRGTLISAEGSGSDQKVTVEFRGRDRKKFILRFIKPYMEG